MNNIQKKKQDDNKKTMDTAVARVSGAVEVAGVAVSTTMSIKDEALDNVEALRTESNVKAGNHAVKKINKNSSKISKISK